MTDKYRVHEIVKFNYSDIGEYIDENHTDRPLRNDILVELLNKLHEENKELKELIKLIANADSFKKEDSVKEILRNEIWGIDSVAGEYSSAWHDYVILSNFFKKHYGEDWDNDKFD